MIYPGRIPGQIVYNILHHYTEVGDLCLFPFVGGGTEADVAHYMGREYYAWDIHHVDAVAQRHGERYFTANSLAPWQVTKVLEEKADLVFADVPRFMWGNGKWEDSDNEDNYDISKQDLEEFMESMELVARNAFMSLKNGGKFAILLRQPGFVDIPSEDLTFTLMSEKFNRFELVSRLHVTFPTTAHRPTEKGRFANECMDLLIMEKH
jgi:DNA modification methylase